MSGKLTFLRLLDDALLADLEVDLDADLDFDPLFALFLFFSNLL